MKKIEKVIRDTGKDCVCTGNIVETFAKKYGKNNGIIGPGCHTPSWVESIGFGCDKCGHQYGAPVFERTPPNEQMIFELNLYKAKLIKKISISDLPIEIKYKKGKAFHLDLGNKQKLKGNEMIEIEVKPKRIPIELKNLKVGTEIFVLPSESRNPRNTFSTIQLITRKDTKTFKIKQSCIS